MGKSIDTTIGVQWSCSHPSVKDEAKENDIFSAFILLPGFKKDEVEVLVYPGSVYVSANRKEDDFDVAFGTSSYFQEEIPVEGLRMDDTVFGRLEAGVLTITAIPTGTPNRQIEID